MQCKLPHCHDEFIQRVSIHRPDGVTDAVLPQSLCQIVSVGYKVLEKRVVVLNRPCFSVLLGRLASGCCDARYDLWQCDGSVCLSHDAHWRQFVGVQHDISLIGWISDTLSHRNMTLWCRRWAQGVCPQMYQSAPTLMKYCNWWMSWMLRVDCCNLPHCL